METKPTKIPTIDKEQLRHAIIEAVKQADSRIGEKQAKDFVELFFNLLKASLCQDKKIALKGYGRLVPRFKPAGRLVRNPKTGEPYTMHDTVTVMYNGKTQTTGKLNTSDIVTEMTLLALVTHKIAQIAVTAIIEQMIKTQDGSHRMEIRGFGVFHSHWLNPRNGRNPKTGEAVVVPGKYKPMFKISRTLRQQLIEAYTQETPNA